MSDPPSVSRLTRLAPHWGSGNTRQRRVKPARTRKPSGTCSRSIYLYLTSPYSQLRNLTTGQLSSETAYPSSRAYYSTNQVSTTRAGALREYARFLHSNIQSQRVPSLLSVFRGRRPPTPDSSWRSWPPRTCPLRTRSSSSRSRSRPSHDVLSKANVAAASSARA